MEPSASLERRLMLSFAVFGIYWGAWGALLPEIKLNVGATEAALGAMLLFIAVGAIAGMLAAGKLFDRLGTSVLVPAHVLFAAATIPPALAGRPVELIPALLFLGLSTGMLDVAINGAASSYETRTDRLLMGRVHAMFSLGVLVTGVSVGALRDAGATPFMVLVPIAGLILVMAAIVRKVTLRKVAERTAAAPRMTGLVLLFGTLCGLAFLIEDGMLSWSAIHLEETLGGSPTIGGLGPTSLAAAMVAGRALTSKISARFRDRSILTVCGAIAAVGAGLVAVAPAPAVALIGIVVAGSGISVCAPLIFSLAGRSAPPGRKGVVISRITMIAYTGFIIGPPLVGGIAGIAGLRAGVGAMAIIGLALAAGSRWVPSRTPDP